MLCEALEKGFMTNVIVRVLKYVMAMTYKMETFQWVGVLQAISVFTMA